MSESYLRWLIISSEGNGWPKDGRQQEKAAGIFVRRIIAGTWQVVTNRQLVQLFCKFLAMAGLAVPDR